MAKYFKVQEAIGLDDEQMVPTEVDSAEILIARVEGNLYAVGNRCTHAKGKLSAGKLEGFVVTCPVQALNSISATDRLSDGPSGRVTFRG